MLARLIRNGSMEQFVSHSGHSEHQSYSVDCHSGFRPDRLRDEHCIYGRTAWQGADFGSSNIIVWCSLRTGFNRGCHRGNESWHVSRVTLVYYLIRFPYLVSPFLPHLYVALSVCYRLSPQLFFYSYSLSAFIAIYCTSSSYRARSMARCFVFVSSSAAFPLLVRRPLFSFLITSYLM